jgi:hypothetical protein
MSKEKDKEMDVSKHPWITDIRLVERNIKKGVISRKDYEKYLKALPDQQDKVATMGDPSALDEDDLDIDDEDELDDADEADGADAAEKV